MFLLPQVVEKSLFLFLKKRERGRKVLFISENGIEKEKEKGEGGEMGFLTVSPRFFSGEMGCVVFTRKKEKKGATE